MKKLPPKEKIFEAYTALADGHVEMEGHTARVVSSNEAKTYTVSIEDDVYKSDDSATFWQGYAGYPVLAVLMKEGRLPYNKELAEKLKHVDWHKVNDQYKRNYQKAAMAVLEERHIDIDEAYNDVNHVFSCLQALPIEVRRLTKRRK